MGLEGNRKGGVIDRTEEGSHVRRERVGGARDIERPQIVAGLALELRSQGWRWSRRGKGSRL